MTLTLFVAANCGTCKKVEMELRNLLEEIREVSLIVYNIEEKHPSNLVIVPALFVEDELYSYGEFESQKLKNYLTKNISGRNIY